MYESYNGTINCDNYQAKAEDSIDSKIVGEYDVRCAS